MPDDKPLQYANCRLPGSGFEDVDLSHSRFSDVSLKNAQFENVALTNASFRNVCLGGVAIQDANLAGMTINGILVTELLDAFESRPAGHARYERVLGAAAVNEGQLQAMGEGPLTVRTREGAIHIALLGAFLLPVLAGCAAHIIKSEPEPQQLIQAGVAQAELSLRLGTPIESVAILPAATASALWQADPAIIILSPNQVAVSRSSFRFKGRLDKDARAGQAGFDSFMTLGLAELYLIPKAIFQRGVGENYLLLVWFDSEARAVACKWILMEG